MASHELSNVAVQTDAWTCRAGAQLLRARRKAGLAGEDWSRDADRLLRAVAHELETDPDSLPTAVRYAAVQLAERIGQRCSIPIPHPIPRSTVRHRGPIEDIPPGPRRSSEVDHGSVVPHTRSLRLGRMG